MEQLDEALKVLTVSARYAELTQDTGRAQASGANRRMMSAASRKRIAAAQRVRWAKWKAAQPKK
jgi:hypothetical protein